VIVNWLGVGADVEVSEKTTLRPDVFAVTVKVPADELAVSVGAVAIP
jgi:hypothetical protein